MLCVLMLASGASWEPAAVGSVQEDPGTVLVKRCVDIDDLLATGATGQAEVAVISLDTPGLDRDAVALLGHHGVRVVLVGEEDGREDQALRLARLGACDVVPVAEVRGLAGRLRTLHSVSTRVRSAGEDSAFPVLPTLSTAYDVAGTHALPADPAFSPDESSGEPVGPRPVVAVWGPGGAPGRTTLATAFAGELALRAPAPVLVVDADPYGGSVAQHLGVLDEASGLLSAARLSPTELPARLPGLCRAVGPGALGVLTGLPRPDRWTEVRAGVLTDVVEAARRIATVVVDTGFGLQGGPGDPAGAWQGPGRDAMTVEALESADEVLVVGSADPVGLSRLARGLVDLDDLLGARPVRVVVNRMRPSLGWSRSEVAAMVEGFAPISGLHFLPEDRGAVDRALVAGRTLTETGDSELRRAVAQVVDAVLPETAGATAGGGLVARVRRRTAGRALPR